MTPHKRVTHGIAALYVLSGISQPLIMTLCKEAGLAEPTSQLYMFFYYLGPLLLIFSLHDAPFPSRRAVIKACLIAVFDIFAQAMNYTGAGLAGATIFAVIYSSVTIWTAVFSRIFLNRSVNWVQWVAIFTVCGGLVLTTTDSISVGRDVARGAVLILVGSAIHGSVYVMSESVMTGEDTLTVRQNAAIQSGAAIVFSSFWQVFYTAPRFDTLILAPACCGDDLYSGSCDHALVRGGKPVSLSNLLSHVKTLSWRINKCRSDEGSSGGDGVRGGALDILWSRWRRGNVLHDQQVCCFANCCEWCYPVQCRKQRRQARH